MRCGIFMWCVIVGGILVYSIVCGYVDVYIYIFFHGNRDLKTFKLTLIISIYPNGQNE